MLQVYFGNFADGRLKRLPFVGYILVLGLLLFTFVFGTVALIAGAEYAIGGNLADAQDLIRKSLGIPFLIIFAVFMILLLVAGLNITAKRARDCGLPGWLFVAVLVAVSMIASWLISQNASQAISTLVFAGLALIPSDTFQRGSK